MNLTEEQKKYASIGGLALAVFLALFGGWGFIPSLLRTAPILYGYWWLSKNHDKTYDWLKSQPKFIASMAILGIVLFGPFLLIFLAFPQTDNAGNYDGMGPGALLAFVVFPFIFSLIRHMNSRHHGEQYDAERRQYEGLHGTSSFRKPKEIFGSYTSGIYVGGGCRWDGLGHIATFGSNRSGKGSSLIVPQILVENEAFMLVVDPQGENCALTKDHLKKQGYKVIVLNPTGIPFLPNDDTFNPFDVLDTNSISFTDDCELLAECIIPAANGASDNSAHFQGKGREWYRAMMMHLLTSHEIDKSPLKLYEWFRMAGSTDFDKILAQAMTSDELDGLVRLGASGIKNGLFGGTGDGGSSIVSTITRGDDVFTNTSLRRSVKRSTFSPKNIITEKTAVFICLPIEFMHTQRAWLRLVIGSFIIAARRRQDTTRKMLMILDEFFALGYLQEIENGISNLAKLNVTLWAILQDINQLKAIYPKTWQSFVGNATIKHFLGAGDVETAEYCTKLLGKTTEITAKSRYDANTKSFNNDFQAHGRDLMTPQEVMSCDRIITIANPTVNGGGNTLLYKIPYYEIEWMREAANNNPYLQKASHTPLNGKSEVKLVQ